MARAARAPAKIFRRGTAEYDLTKRRYDLTKHQIDTLLSYVACAGVLMRGQVILVLGQVIFGPRGTGTGEKFSSRDRKFASNMT